MFCCDSNATLGVAAICAVSMAKVERCGCLQFSYGFRRDGDAIIVLTAINGGADDFDSILKRFFVTTAHDPYTESRDNAL